MYKSWGLKNVHFWPLGSLTSLEDVADLNYNKIRNPELRNNQLVFIGGYQYHRKDRFDQLLNKFPNSFCAGSGWPLKFIDWDDMWKLYRNTQIGWNMHNSSGPINFRTYELPAYGILQICDNKQKLGEIFELNKEVIGFDTTQECIEATQYYLTHLEEQREIAYAGFQRWKEEYNPDAIWSKATKIIEKYIEENSIKRQKNHSSPIILKLKIKKSIFKLRIKKEGFSVKKTFRWAKAKIKKLILN